MGKTKIAEGQVFSDADGAELTVVEIDRENGEIEFEDEDGAVVFMSTSEVKAAIRSGELEAVEIDDAGNGEGSGA